MKDKEKIKEEYKKLKTKENQLEKKSIQISDELEKIQLKIEEFENDYPDVKKLLEEEIVLE